MKGFRWLGSPALVLLLLRPLLASGDSVSRLQIQTMSTGGGARGFPEDSHRLLRFTVPGSDPERSNELLLQTAGKGDSPEQRHHVLYFPGDVQVTRARPPRHAHAGSHLRRVWGRPLFLPDPFPGKGPWRATVQRVAVNLGAPGRKERRDREWDMYAQLQSPLRGLCVP